jgi:hypothetical protein
VYLGPGPEDERDAPVAVEEGEDGQDEVSHGAVDAVAKLERGPEPGVQRQAGPVDYPSRDEHRRNHLIKAMTPITI